MILIWVQTACKGYEQTTKVAASIKAFNKGCDVSIKIIEDTCIIIIYNEHKMQLQIYF